MLSPRVSAFKQYTGIFVRGMAMGAADIVPGVSGGTIALITGIYDRFINSLKSLGTPATIRELLQGRWQEFAKRTDFVFISTLFAGILTSIASLATIITYLMHTYPHPVWAAFLGLVLASAILMLRQLRQSYGITFGTLVLVVAGTIFAYWIGRLTPQDFEIHSWHFFAGGAIAICAMILPGISGSFLLLMLGLYGAVLSAVNELDLVRLSLFAAGCGVGLLSFSHVLSACLQRFPAGSHAFLVGLMLGATEKLWPWKHTLSTRVNSSGEVVPLLQNLVSPFEYERLMGESAALEVAAITFTLAFLCILVVESKDGKTRE